MNKQIKDYLSKIGSKGGKSGVGKSKARTSEQARKAVMTRWNKVKDERKQTN